MANTRTRLEKGIQQIRNGNFSLSLVAAGAINPNRFVVVDNTGKAAQAGVSATSVIGTLVGSKAAAANEIVWIENSNVVLVEGDGSVTAGDLVASDANGRATTIAGATAVGTVATAWLILGVALETDGSAGETIAVRLFR
jgi:hypothetical protein